MKLKAFGSVLTVAIGLMVSGCAKVENIPAGYVGKLLTPTGWEKSVHEAGQIDIGESDSNGRGNSLVLLEASSIMVKESFIKDDPARNNQDHRFMTTNRIPVAADIYSRLALPEDQGTRDQIFAMVTPKDTGNPRVKIIRLEDVYNTFASPDIRSKSRAIMSQYADDMAIVADYDKLNEKLLQMFVATFKGNRVPLQVLSVNLSNVKADDVVMQANSQKASAQAELDRITLISNTLKDNPGYLEYYKWTTLKEIAALRTQAGQNTIIITDGGTKGNDSWAAAEYMRQQLKK